MLPRQANCTAAKIVVLLVLLAVGWPTVEARAQDGPSRTLTIYAAECPAGYAGDASADECDANPIAGVPFRVGRPYSEAFYEDVPTDVKGLVAFDIAGLPLDGTLRIIETLPAGAERFAAYCVDSSSVPLPISYPADVGNPALGVADVAVGDVGDVACDWYNVPAEASQPRDTEETQRDNPNAGASGPATDRTVAIYSGTCSGLDAQPRYTLNPLVTKDGEPEGPTAASPAIPSFSIIDVSMTDLLADNHAVAVRSSAANASSSAATSVVACGEIGGVRREAGSLAIGLREQNGSGVEGIVSFTSDPDTAGSTQVTVFVAEHLAEDD